MFATQRQQPKRFRAGAAAGDGAAGAGRARRPRALTWAAAMAVAVALAWPATALGQVSFGPAASFAAGDAPASVAVGDFNGDSDPDLAVANFSSGNVSVLLGGADGSFGAATNFAAGATAESVAVGDFNGDNDPDLAVAGGSGNVSVLLGGAGGSFGAATNFAAGASPYSVAVGDFNGDSDPDLAVANTGSGQPPELPGEAPDNGYVMVLLGGAGGSFGAATRFDAGVSPWSVAVGDFNGDKDPDLAVANGLSGDVSVLLGRAGGGSFGAATNFAAGASPRSVAVGDFNGDKDPDLAVARRFAGSVSVLLGKAGGGDFNAATQFAAGSLPNSVAVGDFDGDSDADLAVATESVVGKVSLLLGAGNGSFGAATNFAAGGDFSGSVAVGDFDGDSDRDLTVANRGSLLAKGNVSVLLNTHSPTAKADSYEVFEDDSLSVEAPGVLANDSDADGDSLTAVPVSFPVHGDLTFRDDGSLNYTPYRDYNGPDSFSYQVSDGGLDSEPVTVTLDVKALNDRPVASNDFYEIDEDTLLDIAPAGVLDNDSDLDGDSLTPELVSGPAHGRLLEFRSDGSFRYMPDGDYNGYDSFSYRVRDPDTWDSDPVTVRLYVHAQNDGPRAEADSYTTDEDTPLTLAAPGVLDNDQDPDRDGLAAALVSGPARGTLELNADGSLSYTPAPDYNGSDSFSYKASGGNQDSDPATVTINIKAVNDAPSGNDDGYETNEDESLNVDSPGVLGNDADPEGDGLAAALDSGPQHGQLELNGDGSLVYSPERDYNGTDSFSYRASDGGLESDPVTVTIDVTPVDDPAPPAGPAPTPPAGPASTPPAGPAAPPSPAAPRKRAIAQLRLARRCVRPSRSGRVRIRMSLRMARPAPLQIRIDRAVRANVPRSCPSANPRRRFSGRFRSVETLDEPAARPGATAASVTRWLTLRPRLSPGLYRISVRAKLDRNRLSAPLRRYLRVLG